MMSFNYCIEKNNSTRMRRILIENFGPISKANIELGDLTIFVGPQASGKTVALETIKLAEDYASIIDKLNKNNYITSRIGNVLNLYFGRGMASMWRESTRIVVDDIPFGTDRLSPSVGKENTQETVFYIPAQRVTSVADGAGKNFQSFGFKTPYVNRQFGDTLQRFIQNGIGQQTVLFPMKTRLKSQMRKRFDDSIYHGARVMLYDDDDLSKQMVLNIGDSILPVQVWSAGQREFTPLLLGIYCLTGAPQNVLRNDLYNSVIIEEPEMGLHPKAISDVILQIIELVQGEKGKNGPRRGYQVMISTHSSVFLDFAWAFELIKRCPDDRIRYSALSDLFDIDGDGPMMRMLEGVFDKKIKVYYLGKQSGVEGTVSQDISSLDIWDDNTVMSEWGGMTTFASKAADIVSSYSLNEAQNG